MEIEKNLKISANKHASSTSSVQQSADIGRQFALFKLENKTTTAINLPHGFGLKALLEYKLDMFKASGALMLKLPARKAVIDHYTCCLKVLGKTMAQKSIKKIR